jgi:hypothetical protein
MRYTTDRENVARAAALALGLLALVLAIAAAVLALALLAPVHALRSDMGLV